jgi:hypothetical protein
MNKKGAGRTTPLCTLEIACTNVRGCSTSVSKRSEISSVFVRREIDVLAVNETKVKGKCVCLFGW